jgi:uncharacterized protein
VVIAAVLILFQMLALGPYTDWFTGHSESSREVLEWYQLGHLIRTGTFLELIGYRFEHWYPVNLALEVTAQGSPAMGAAVFGLFMFMLPNIFAYFLLGLAAGRSGLFRDVEQHLNGWRRTFLITFPLGLSINIGGTVWINSLHARMDQAALLPWENILQYVVSNLMPVLTIGYISGLVLLNRRTRILRILIPAGQMPLTNYLLQNLFFTWLFLGYGFGLYGKLAGMWVIVIAIGVWCLQLVASQAWLRKFRFGPVEWLWRSLTYWKRQPMRPEDEKEIPPLHQKR